MPPPGAPHPGQMPAAPPAHFPAPVAAPAKPPSKPGGSISKYLKYIAAVAVIGVGYGAHAMYERYQPYEWSGSVEMHAISVGSRMGGRVAKILVREGQQVQKGDVLIVLEPGPLQARRMIAQAELEAADANLARASNGARPEEVAQALARVVAARAAAAQASTQAEFEQREVTRSKTLLHQGAVSTAETDAVSSRFKTAASASHQALARAREEEAGLKVLTAGTRPEEVRAARALVDVAKAKLAEIDGQLEEMNIRAPGPARIEAITVRPGDILKADSTAVQLLEAGELYVRIYVPEPRLSEIRIGQEVPVSVDSFPSRTFRGRVEHINEVGEFTPRRLVTTEERADEVFAARIALLEGENDLRAGMAAFIHVKKKR
jgi:HlyD family secretion protein